MFFDILTRRTKDGRGVKNAGVGPDPRDEPHILRPRYGRVGSASTPQSAHGMRALPMVIACAQFATNNFLVNILRQSRRH